MSRCRCRSSCFATLAATSIVDGGNPLAVARDPHAHWGGLADIFEVHMTEEQHCASQLARLGVDAGSVTHVVQTHLHIDHTGALGHFPDAAVVVHERELEAARAADSPEASGYVRADYRPPRAPVADGGRGSSICSATARSG